jgi:ribose transport system ATP-binding protein
MGGILSGKENILELRGVTLSFPGARALSSIDLDIEAGEVHILLGENGAGKSSLVKVLCGIYRPDSGAIKYKGASFAPQTPLDAIRAGIRVVYQEFNLLSYMTVAENIFFERLPRRAGMVDFGRLNRDAKVLLEEVGLDIPPKTPVELLGVAQMQLLEIAKALSGDSSVLILDEPTATLTPTEIEKLFAIIRRLKARGVTIIYISHRLKEIFQIGDRVTVLRNGSMVATKSIREVTVPDIVKMMVGREMSSEYPFLNEVVRGPVILEVRGLKRRGNPNAVSFKLREGEILGISGLVGSGRTELVRALFGADTKVEGEVLLRGKPKRIESPRDAVEAGICLLTEDRKNQGLILDMACDVNITLPALSKVSRGGLMDFKAEREAAATLIKQLGIKTPSPAQWVHHLSGGNQQKIVLAKWLFREAQVLILDEPTRGIDVGAKYEIYLLLWKLAAAGKCIIVVSSDLPELLGVCHRIVVLSNGKLTADIERPNFDQELILSHAYREYMDSETTT